MTQTINLRARRAGQCMGCKTQLFDYEGEHQPDGHFYGKPFAFKIPVNQVYRLSTHDKSRRVCGKCKVLMQL